MASSANFSYLSIGNYLSCLDKRILPYSIYIILYGCSQLLCDITSLIRIEMQLHKVCGPIMHIMTMYAATASLPNVPRVLGELGGAGSS